MPEKTLTTTFTTTFSPEELSIQCHLCVTKKAFDLCPIRTYLRINPPFHEFCPIADKAQCDTVTPEVWKEFFNEQK